MEQTARVALVDLVRRVQNGDEDALRELIVAYQCRISGFVFTLINQSCCVEDLSQQIFIKMIRAIDHLEAAEQFESWLFRIARNTCMDYLRQQKLRRIFLPFLEEHESVPESNSTVGSEELDALRHALANLRPADRALLVLVQEGNSYVEISKTLEINVASVKARVHRAREHLRQHYLPAHAEAAIAFRRSTADHEWLRHSSRRVSPQRAS
jgi:RNA polymerase sigma-70 factor (ECF subfamily)